MSKITDEQKIALFDRAHELSAIKIVNFGYSDIGDIFVSLMQGRMNFTDAMVYFSWLEQSYKKDASRA